MRWGNLGLCGPEIVIPVAWSPFSVNLGGGGRQIGPRKFCSRLTTPHIPCEIKTKDVNLELWKGLFPPLNYPIRRYIMATKDITLSANLSTLTSDVVSGDRYIRNKWDFLSDGYLSEGITALMLTKPERGEKSPFEKLHKSIERAIVDSFDDDVKILLTKEPKTLSKVDQGTRRYWISQTASYFGKIRTHLKNKEEALENPEESKTRKTKSKKDRILEGLAQVIKTAKGYDSATFDIKAFLSKMQEAENIVKGK